jgi:hypothetical protein
MAFYHHLLLTLAYATLLVSLSEGYPGGAPESVCQSMMPNHNNTLPRSDTPKYEVQVSGTTYTVGGSVNVTLVVLDYSWPMEGFLLEGRRSSDNGIVGQFTSLPIGTKLACSGGGVTHTSNTKLNSTSFVWSAPSNSATGDIYFVATVVRGWSRGFWVDLRSPKVAFTSSSPGSGSTSTTLILLSVTFFVFVN